MSDTKQKQSLWDRLRGKKPPTPEKATEEKFYNPLELRIGQLVMLDDLDIDNNLEFNVDAISEVRRSILGKSFFMVDYDLVAKPIDGDVVRMRVRLNPLEEPDKESGMTHSIILLEQYDSLEYDQGLHEIVVPEGEMLYDNADPDDDEAPRGGGNGGLNVDDESGGQVDATFQRINDLNATHLADVAVITDENDDGKIEDSEVSRHVMKFWDYWRDIEKYGVKEVEFLYVEMNDETGWFSIWKGREVNPEAINVF